MRADHKGDRFLIRSNKTYQHVAGINVIPVSNKWAAPGAQSHDAAVESISAVKIGNPDSYSVNLRMKTMEQMPAPIRK